MKTYIELKNEIESLSKEISFLHKRQDALYKQLQEVCPHENIVSINNVEYLGTLLNIEYCKNCGKTMPKESAKQLLPIGESK